MAKKPTRNANSKPRMARADMVMRGLIALCVLLALADFVIHRHAYFVLEATPLFFAIMGAASMALVAGLSVLLRRLVIRPEDYYDRQTLAGNKAADKTPKKGGKNA